MGSRDTVALSPRDKLLAARYLACERAPYVTAGLYCLVPVEAPGLGTLAVTPDAILRWDPAAVAAWSIDEVATTWEHEQEHVRRNHFGRANTMGVKPGSPGARIWNLACDAEINDDLVAAHRPMEAEAWVVPATLGCPPGQTAEQYYQHLLQNPPPADLQPLHGHECGGAAGNPGADEPPPSTGDAPPNGQVVGRSPSEVEAVRHQCAIAILAQHSQQPGSVPAGLVRWANVRVARPQVPWSQRLARVCRRVCAVRAGAQEYSYSRPSRRQAAMGYGGGVPILPGMVRPIPRIAFYADTSGSMDERAGRQLLGELDGVIRAVGGEVTFGACDAALHGTGRIQSWRQALPLLKGGGGTEFSAIFADVAAQKPCPDLVIIATDGYVDLEAAPPAGVEVVWLLVGQHRPTMPWGTVIEIPTGSHDSGDPVGYGG